MKIWKFNKCRLSAVKIAVRHVASRMLRIWLYTSIKLTGTILYSSWLMVNYGELIQPGIILDFCFLLLSAQVCFHFCLLSGACSPESLHEESCCSGGSQRDGFLGLAALGDLFSGVHRPVGLGTFLTKQVSSRTHWADTETLHYVWPMFGFLLYSCFASLLLSMAYHRLSLLTLVPSNSDHVFGLLRLLLLFK